MLNTSLTLPDNTVEPANSVLPAELTWLCKKEMSKSQARGSRNTRPEDTGGDIHKEHCQNNTA